MKDIDEDTNDNNIDMITINDEVVAFIVMIDGRYDI